MSWKVVRTTLHLVLLSSLMMLVVTTTASAGANARSGEVRWALAATSVPGDPCLDFQLRVGGNALPANALCTSGPLNGNFAHAKAHANRREAWTRTKTEGWASAGGGLRTMATVPSTADTFYLTHSNTGLNQTLLTLAGEMSLDPSSTDNKGAAQTLRVTVYPDTLTAAAGKGWLARGELRAWANRDLGETRPSGLFSASDFIVTHGSGNTLTVTTVPGLTKTVNGVPDTAKVIVELSVEAASLPVPGLSPVGLILLTVLLAAAGFYVLQTRRRAAAA